MFQKKRLLIGFWLATLIFTGLFLALHTSESEAKKRVYVRGYYRSDGTYVRPHYRTAPDGNRMNNYSTPGNYNPNTGRVTTGNLNTYLNRYNTRRSRSQSSYSTFNTRRNNFNSFNTRRSSSLFNTRQSNSNLFNTTRSNSGLFNTRVRGYQRQNGTYVSPYYRTRADGNPLNNYSTPGNYNLNTGRTTTGNLNTYLNRYYYRRQSSPTPSNSMPLPQDMQAYQREPSRSTLSDILSIIDTW